MWEHSEQFIYFTVWAWRFVVAKTYGAFSKSAVIKDFGVELLSLLGSFGFILCNFVTGG